MNYPQFICGIAALTLAGFGITATTAYAKNNFDGKWSVVIVTTKGDCDRAYRYPINIIRGVLRNGGDAAVDISGRVRPNGMLRVRVSAGDKYAMGTGRLANDEGSGSWHNSSCTGTWTAERRPTRN